MAVRPVDGCRPRPPWASSTVGEAALTRSDGADHDLLEGDNLAHGWRVDGPLIRRGISKRMMRASDEDSGHHVMTP